MSIEHIYGQKLRELEAENQRLTKIVKGVENVVLNIQPKDDKYLIIHKIKGKLLGI
jgi:hypothetical protein